jgi:hypothetical protein
MNSVFLHRPDETSELYNLLREMHTTTDTEVG